jgi:small conductance mechanosensitive channel
MDYLDIPWTKFYEGVITFGPRLVGALLVLLIGWWIIKLIQNFIRKGFEKRDMEPSLRGFLYSMTGILLKIMLLISVIGMLGVEMTSFIAILGAAGLAVGMALSGTLQNFAGGVMILLFKPFKAGDYIEAQGYSGSVSEIQIFNTILKTPDNKTIIIPNGALATGSMINYSAEPQRRVDFVFGIGYGDDVELAKRVLKRLTDEDDRILKDPEPFIAVTELGDSSVNLVLRAWADASDYWGIYFDMHEKVYKAFPEEGLNIPFPQMDLHVQK